MYYSTTQFLPADAVDAPDSLEFVPRLAAPMSPGNNPVLMSLDKIFELAWRLRTVHMVASIRYDFTGAPPDNGGVDIDDTVDKVLTADANEVTQHQDDVLNPDWMMVPGTSFLDNTVDPPFVGASSMQLDYTTDLGNLKRTPDSGTDPQEQSWLPFLRLRIFIDGVSFFTSGPTGDPLTPVGNADVCGLAVPMYADAAASDLDVTSFAASIVPTGFWPYAHGGSPVYAAGTGARIRSPFSSQR